MIRLTTREIELLLGTVANAEIDARDAAAWNSAVEKLRAALARRRRWDKATEIVRRWRARKKR
jgi:hypothetical protein